MGKALIELRDVPVTRLAGVGPAKAESLAQLDITTVLDLLLHYPRRYVDRTKQQIKDSPEFDPESFRGEAYRDKIGGYYSDTYPMGEVAPPTPAGTVPPAAAPTPGGMVPPAAAPPLRADTEGSGPEREGDFPR